MFLFTLHAFSQSGTLDGAFGSNGEVHTGFGTNNSIADALAVQPDGKIIVGGSAYSANTVKSWERDTDNAVLVRYNADGSRDTSFGTEGFIMNDYYTVTNAQGWNSDVLNIKVMADGKILTYGGGYLGYGGITVLTRYNCDGSLDPTFGNNGHVSCNSSPITGADSLLILPDGKLVVLGVQNLQPTPGVYISNFLIERYTTDGLIDSSFGTDGLVITSFGFGYNNPRGIALQPDGKVVAAGVSFNNQFALARYTVDGQLDTTFDGDGKVTTSFGTGIYNLANFVSVHSDGKILVAGTAWNSTATPVTSFALARYNANGSLDTSFDSDGKATSPFDAEDLSLIITSVLEQADGKLLVTTTISPNGYTVDLTDNFTTRRYNTDASADISFGTYGKVSTACQEGYNRSKMAAIQSDGKIVVAGFSHPPLSEQNDFTVVRYSSTGVLDTSFDTDGKIFTAFDSSNDESTILLLQPDNKLIAVGTKRNSPPNQYGTKDIVLSRYNSDGSLDSSFGTSGKVVSVFSTNVNSPTCAVLLVDGRIVVANSYYSFYGDIYHYELIRYTTEGNIDTTFGTDGKVALNSETTSILSQPGGKIIITSITYDAQNTASLIVKRFNDNGTLDTGFGTEGIAILQGTFYTSIPTTAILQPDGKIVISTSSPNSDGVMGFAVFRFNTDGSPDTDFKAVIAASGNAYGSTAKAAFLQADGKIIVAGTRMLYDGLENYYFVTARYNSNGSPDTTYGTNGILTAYIDNYYGAYYLVQSVVLQPDGKFVVALSKPEQNPAFPNPNSYDFAVIRYDIDGSLDSDFGTNGKVVTSFHGKYDEAFSMVLQPDNKIVLGGTTDTGINRDFALDRYENAIELTTNSFEDSRDIVLYPNPVKGILNIQLPNQKSSNIIKLSIYNIMGQLVYQSSDKNLKVDTDKFTTGVYTLFLKTDKVNWSGKFIKD